MTARRRIPRLVWVAGFLVALAVALWAGTAVRQHLDGPSPIPAVKAATTAYAEGDCQALKALSAEPAAVTCQDVDRVRQAYVDEGLRPASFTYELASESEDVATVRILYEREGRPAVEMVRLEKQDGDWKVTPSPGDQG